ncbi:MAG TPA: hypothetical protein VMW18_21050, partial [Candidatus Binatia bacterium]|nr:hypothetical protein [Candidatus Binatia bacterium]
MTDTLTARSPRWNMAAALAAAALSLPVPTGSAAAQNTPFPPGTNCMGLLWTERDACLAQARRMQQQGATMTTPGAPSSAGAVGSGTGNAQTVIPNSANPNAANPNATVIPNNANPTIIPNVPNPNAATIPNGAAPSTTGTPSTLQGATPNPTATPTIIPNGTPGMGTNTGTGVGGTGVGGTGVGGASSGGMGGSA